MIRATSKQPCNAPMLALSYRIFHEQKSAVSQVSQVGTLSELPGQPCILSLCPGCGARNQAKCRSKWGPQEAVSWIVSRIA
eukprot:1159631-Pelagomonas_calceolata.AAC.11